MKEKIQRQGYRQSVDISAKEQTEKENLYAIRGLCQINRACTAWLAARGIESKPFMGIRDNFKSPES